MDPAIAKFLGVMLSLAATAIVTYAGITIVHGVASRLKGRGEPEVSPEELEYLRDRADQVRRYGITGKLHPVIAEKISRGGVVDRPCRGRHIP